MKSEPLTPERRREIREKAQWRTEQFPDGNDIITLSPQDVYALCVALEEAEARIAELEAEAKGKEGA